MNKEKLLEIIRMLYTDTAFISDAELEQIITSYSNQLEKDKLNYHISRDEKNYSLTDEVRILKSIFEVIRDNNSLSFWDRYKLEQLYENKLENVLEVMDKEEEKHRRPRTPAVASVNDYDIVQDLGPRRISYEFLPDYSKTLADMCADQMKHAQSKIVESKETKIILPSLKKFKEIDYSLDFYNHWQGGQITISEESKIIVNETVNMITQTEQKNIEIEQQRIDAERQKREIELIQLQQEINRIENEKLEIEKRIKQIYSETLGSFFSRQVLEKYPAEYQTYQQHVKQVKGYSSNYGQITDLKEKFNRISQDLQFFQSVLPAYESFYQRFEQMREEEKKARISENEQERIYNLIHSEENERLRMNNSLYTAWDLGNKAIPLKYQGKTYEEVEVMLAQEKEADRLKRESSEISEPAIKRTDVVAMLNETNAELAQLRGQYGQVTEQMEQLMKQNSIHPIANYQEQLQSLIQQRDMLTGKIGEKMDIQKHYQSRIDYEKEQAHKATIWQVEQLLGIRITDTAGMEVNPNRFGGVPQAIAKDTNTLSQELGSINQQLEALYDDGQLDVKTYQNMKKAVRDQYHNYSKNAPKPVIREEQTRISSPTSMADYAQFEKLLINYIENHNKNLGNVSEILSVTGFPDSIYEVKFDNGEIHKITLTSKEKEFLRNSGPFQESEQLEPSKIK